MDVFPSTSDLPVRIDLWGDEVDRLTEFDPGDQRSVHDLETVELFGCREVLPSEAVRARAAGARGGGALGPGRSGNAWPRANCSTGWSRGCPGCATRSIVLPDLLGSGARVVLVDPRRMRDRAAELNDEEAALAGALAVTWGVVDDDDDGTGPDATDPTGARGGFPRLHVAYERLLERCPAPVLSVVSVASSSATPGVTAQGWEPVHGDRARLAARLGALAEDGYSVTVCAEGAGFGRPSGRRARGGGLVGARPPPRWRRRGGRRPGPARHPGRGGPSRPGLRAAVGQGGGARRGRPHRPPPAHRPARARARPVDGFFDDLAPGDYVVHRQHGVARYGGMVTRTIGGATRDYLLLRVPGWRQALRPVRPDRRAHALHAAARRPSLNRLGGAEWQKTRAKARRRGPRDRRGAGRALPASGSRSPGHAFAPDTPWQAEMEDAFPYPETPDQAKAIAEVKADMESDRADGPAGLRRRRLRQDRGGRAGRVQGGPGRQAGGRARADDAAGPAALPDLRRSLRRLPGPGRDAVAVPDGRPRPAGWWRVWPTGRSTSSSAPTGCWPATSGSRTSGCWWSTRSSASGSATRRRSRSMTDGVDVLTLTASPIPRTLEMALTGIRDLSLINTPPADRQPDPHLRRRVRGSGRGRGHPPGAAARGPGLLRAQPGPGHRGRGRPHPRARARGTGR